MFEEGFSFFWGGDDIASMPKCEATQIYLLAENPEQAYPRAQNLILQKSYIKLFFCS